MPNKIIVFEKISDFFRPFLRCYSLFGYKVYYLRASQKSLSKKWVIDYENKGYISRINPDCQFSYDKVFYPDMAFSNIENIYRSVSAESEAIKRVVYLYQDAHVNLALKKKLIFELSRFYFLNTLLNELGKQLSFKSFYFVPGDGNIFNPINNDPLSSYNQLLKLVKKNKPSSLKETNCSFPLWYVCFSFMRNICEISVFYLKLSGFLILLTYSYLFKKNTAKAKCKNYKYLISIMAPRRQFSNQVQKVDFLVDEKYIRKEDTLFFYAKKLKDEYLEYCERNGLNLIDGFFQQFDFNKAEIRKVFKEVFKTLLSRPIMVHSVREGVLESFLFYIWWQTFADKYAVKNFIGYHDFSSQAICRNIILKKKTRTKTWFYLDSGSSAAFFRTKQEDELYRSFHFMYLYFDYFPYWSEPLVSYFKDHDLAVDKYLATGCLWSEHVRLISEKVIRSDLLERLESFGFKDGHKIIAVFDSSYDYDVIDSYEHGIAFIQDILRLADDVPEAFIIFKEKKARSYVRKYCPALARLYESLQNHARFYLPPDAGSTSEAIAFSDLTISFPFTSTTVEALAARKKALFYDPSGRLKSIFYDNIPDLVCHGYDNLLAMTKRLLFEAKTGEYDLYLDRFIKGNIDPFLDGKGITRFREFINYYNNVV
jgi:polysaccharide biosynthesis PFTS motif protein